MTGPCCASVTERSRWRIEAGHLRPCCLTLHCSKSWLVWADCLQPVELSKLGLAPLRVVLH